MCSSDLIINIEREREKGFSVQSVQETERYIRERERERERGLDI